MYNPLITNKLVSFLPTVETTKSKRYISTLIRHIKSLNWWEMYGGWGQSVKATVKINIKSGQNVGLGV